MAGRQASFLDPQERAKLLKETNNNLRAKRSVRSRKRTVEAEAAMKNTRPTEEHTGEDGEQLSGCFVCKLDNDHSNLLLCEGCNGEYHTYCLTPKLKAIPEDDWYCDTCKPKPKEPEGDGLEQMVCALPPAFSSRFGEICWAQGGVGFGWWPCCIYDPRLTVGQARHEARKNLGKKHLVYFFECYGSPFAIVNNNKIMSWEEGVSEDFHIGRAARNHGKLRYGMFQHALQAATIEESKPIFQRLDSNQTVNDPLTFLPSPVKQTSPVKKRRKKDGDRKRSRSGGKRLESEPEKKRSATVAATISVVAAPAPVEKPVSKAKKPVAKANLNVAFGAAAVKGNGNPAAIAPVRANPVAVATVRANPVAVAPVRAIPAAIAPVRANPVAVAPVRANPVAVAPVRANPAAIAPARANPVAVAPVRANPVAIAPARANPVAAAPARANLAAVAPARPRPAAIAPARAHPAAIFAPARANLAAIAPALAHPAAIAPTSANRIVETEETKMVCKIMKRGQHGEEDKSIGFCILKSRTESFVDARQAMVEQGLPINMDYRFSVPQLGPVAPKQESTLGSMLKFLESCTPRGEIGDGSFANPVKVFLMEAPVL